MARLRTFGQFLVGVVVVGILVNLASDYLSTRYPVAKRLLVQVAVAVAAVWVLFLVTRLALSFITSGRYAVEALILNSRNELLLYRHPHHKRMLPPGGRIKRSEFPNFGLQARLRERLGLEPSQYHFDERFHHGLDVNSGNLGHIQRFAAPFMVQRELHRQRSFVDFHYDLIYVLRLTEDTAAIDAGRYNPVHWVDLTALTEMLAQGRTFPDVLDAYKRVLEIVLVATP